MPWISSGSGCAASSKALALDELETRDGRGRSRRYCRDDGGQRQGGAVPRRRPREGRAGRQCHGRTRPDRRGVWRKTRPALEGGAAAAAQQAGDCRGVARRGAVPGGGADRQGRGRDQAASSSAAWRRRRPVHLGHHRLRHRSEDRLHQCGPAAADAALRARDRHRSGGAERPAGDLSGQRRGGEAHAGELRARRASDRPCRWRDAASGRRTRHRRKPARCAARRGQMR